MLASLGAVEDDDDNDDDLIPESDKLHIINDPDLVLRAAIEFERTGIIPRREDIENIDVTWERDVYAVAKYRNWTREGLEGDDTDNT